MSLDLDIASDNNDFLDRLISQNIDKIENSDRPKGVRSGKELTFFSPIQRITPKHHALARLVAEGLKDVDVAAMTGYTKERVYQLRNDKTFAELVTFYQSEISAKFTDVHEARRRVGLLAIERLSEKLLDDEIGPTLSAKSLTEIAEFALGKNGEDRGPNNGLANGNVSVNITFGKGEEAQSVKTIDLEPSR